MLDSINALPEGATVETKKTLLRSIARQLLQYRESLMGLRTKAVLTIVALNELGEDIDSNWADRELFEYGNELEKRIMIKNTCDQC